MHGLSLRLLSSEGSLACYMTRTYGDHLEKNIYTDRSLWRIQEFQNLLCMCFLKN